MVKNTKENVVKVINAKIDTLRKLYRAYKEEGRDRKAKETMDEIIATHDVLYWLTDEEYFNAIWEIYHPAD